MAKTPDTSDTIRWRELHRAALACGIDPFTLPTPESMDQSRKAREPAPTPELEPPLLSDQEWDAVAPLMPAKSKYLSKLAPRDFINASLFWVWCGRKFALVPTPSIEQFRAKLYRSFVAGLFTSLAQNPRWVHGALPPQTADLLSELASAERAYVKRNNDFRTARLEKLARKKHSSNIRDQNA